MNEVSCPECGSYAVNKTTAVDESGMAEFRCSDCGHYFVEAVEHSVQADDAKRPLTGRNGKSTNVLADGAVLETHRR